MMDNTCKMSIGSGFKSIRVKDPRETPTNTTSKHLSFKHGSRSAMSPFLPSSTSSTARNEDVNTFVEEKLANLCPDFKIFKKIGEGTFSKVYHGVHKSQARVSFALKYIIPNIKVDRIMSEVRFLRDCGGDSNVCGISDLIYSDTDCVIIMPYFKHDKFQDYLKYFTLNDICSYMKNLMIALKKVHKSGIIHRDVKPSNFLYSSKHQKYMLVDFGLAQKVTEFKKLRPIGSIDITKSLSQVRLSGVEKGSDKFVEDKSGKVITKGSLKRSSDSYNESYLKKLKTDESSVFHSPITPSMCPLMETTNSSFSLSNRSNNNIPNVSANQMSENEDPSTTPKKSPSKKGTPKKSPSRKATPKMSPSKKTTPMDSVIPDTPHKKVAKDDGTRRSLVPKTLKFDDRMDNKKSTNPLAPLVTNHGDQGRFIIKTPNSSFTINNSLSKQNVRHEAAQRLSNGRACSCLKQPQVCFICENAKDMMACRAGTPGFRAPEVLMKVAEQSTAIDIWSAGVIMMALLTKRYPFFRNTDDMNSLSEICDLLGTEKVQAAATKLGRHITLSPEHVRPARNLKTVCEELRNGESITDEAISLLSGLLDPFPETRLTAEEALNHPFLQPIKDTTGWI